MVILLHSSKTMRSRNHIASRPSTPIFMDKATILANSLMSLSEPEITRCMHVSPSLAKKIRETLQAWNTVASKQTPAIDCFLGDIYSGFQATSLTSADRAYAQKCLRIISGLYGILRPLDGVCPYRLELAYKLPSDSLRNLYAFWGDSLARTIQNEQLVINLSSVEYSKAILPYLTDTKVITPKFMTIDPNSRQPKFVAVHAKIARGAMARWLIVQRAQGKHDILAFSDLNYHYSPELSSPDEPTFIAEQFGGLGLSVRLA